LPTCHSKLSLAIALVKVYNNPIANLHCHGVLLAPCLVALVAKDLSKNNSDTSRTDRVVPFAVECMTANV